MRTKRVKAIVQVGSEYLVVKNRFSFHDDGFGLPGGGMKHKETPEDTLYRELEEEIGLTRADMKEVVALGNAHTKATSFFKPQTEYIFFKIVCAEKPTLKQSLEIKKSIWTDEKDFISSLSSFYQSLLSQINLSSLQ